MLRCVLYVFSVLLTSGLSFSLVEPGPKIVPTKGELWPKAHLQKKSNQYFTFNPSQFTVNTTKETCDLLSRAIQRYSFIVRNTNNLKRLSLSRRRRGQPETGTTHTDDHQGLLRELVVELDTPCGDDYPYFNMDESYDLIISTRSRLSSVSVWGILRGLETWSQLFYISDDYKEVFINATHITDFPRYAHRGLLLDTSRHFISLANILKTLDAMAMNKMNVFHWHIVDDQSFPYQSEKFPELSAKGAYHPTLVYTKADIQKVVQYARDRGIRVLPEIDVPGHTRSWGASHPDLLTKCYKWTNEVVGLGPMDPTNQAVYTTLKELIQEVQEWFPDKYFHVGGDEVEMDCWSSNPDLKKYMRDHNMTTSQLHALFMQKVIPLLGNRSKPIVWQEVFDEGVPLNSDTLVQVWKWGWTDAMVSVLKAGHKVLFSASWYLDHLKSGGDWTDFFLADPRQMVSDRMGNTTVVTNIVGGEACMWGEVVDDTNVMSRTWPRASAAAERLWSPGLADGSAGWRSVLREEWGADWLSEAARRLEEHACRMRRRGLRAQPPNGPGFCLGAV